MRTPALPFVLLLSACAGGYSSETLGLEWSPPKAFRAAGEVAGPPPAARFEPGLTLVRAPEKLPEPGETNLDALMNDALAAANRRALRSRG
ncbi:MAG: hypothetical protein ACK4N5_08965, partial [Myxococcales bacterium]